jgi:hypothetical protein
MPDGVALNYNNWAVRQAQLKRLRGKKRPAFCSQATANMPEVIPNGL